MIADYKIVKGEGAHHLQALIHPLLSQGWEPFGRPFVAGEIDRENEIWIQAMVKTPPPEGVIRVTEGAES